MCGRFSLAAPASVIQEVFSLLLLPAIEPRYNVAPMTRILAVRMSERGEREAVQLKWGLVPFWATDPKIGPRLLNARSETATSKPSFRAAFRKRRCLVVADGFYEWVSEGGVKQPYHMHRPDRRPFAMAGLWERWMDIDGEILETCTILTAAANDALHHVHHRMPCLLDAQPMERWLDPNTSVDEARALLGPYDGDQPLCITAVSRAVNNVRNRGPSLWDPSE